MRLFRALQQSRCNHTTNATSGTNELIYPKSQSSNHYDLSSFLAYALRIDMNTKSTTYAGTHYEYTVQAALERLGMTLKRIGGKDDCGIDILGSWSLPSALQPLKVLVQCKNIAKKVDPSQARELEGSFVGAPLGWREPGVLALLVSQKSATKGVRDALRRSRWPLGYVLCTPEGRIMQMLWNSRAEQEGLAGIEVGLKYTGGHVNEKEVILTWKGESITD
jgi:hypothetical protein